MAEAGRFRASLATVALALLLCTTGLAPIAVATSQDDAGSGSDAGDTFETATEVEQPVPYVYEAELDPPTGDTDDFYRFHVDQGDELVVDVRFPEGLNLSVELLSPEGLVLDAGTQQSDPLTGLDHRVSAGSYLASSITHVPPSHRLRLIAAEAPTEGDYRLHVESEEETDFAYELCFRPCEGPQDRPIGIATPQYHPDNIRVLLVPPPHGDLGDPLGPRLHDYLVTTIRAIESWETAIDEFTDEYPEYDYLDEISITIDVFDGEVPEAVGYDVVVAYIESVGALFRGSATTGGFPPMFDYGQYGLEGKVHDNAGFVLLSLFSSAPRAGQVVPDYPELADLYSTTMHEFGHALGLIHTGRWTEDHGPDLMASPVPYVWGNGDPLGDGGEHTDSQCPSSLDLYGLAQVYDWIPSGEYPSDAEWRPVDSPLEYEWFCQRADPWAPTDLVPAAAS